MAKKVVVIVGTRPEAIKMAPVILELKKDPSFETLVCVTGQHRDMVDVIFNFFNIVPDADFDLLGKTHGLCDLMAQLLQKLEDYFSKVKPDIVLVQGDTTSVLAAGIAAYYQKIPLGHIEAGLRTRNRFSPWPEEGNRAMIAPIADWHFSPTKESADNLKSEGISENQIFITGNTVIDALLYSVDKNKDQAASSGTAFEKMVLITNHRRENLGEGLQNVFLAIKTLAQKHPTIEFVFPMHPNPIIRKQVDEVLGSEHKNIRLIEPLDYPEFVTLIQQSYFVLTDSGGLQEEAPSLGKPVLVTRDTTERPEGILAGTVKLVGTDTKTIVEACDELIEDKTVYEKMSQAINPYGDGTAAQQIVTILKDKL